MWEKLNQFECQPCDHRWYQHRNPDTRMQWCGVGLMVVGGLTILLGLAEFAR